VADVAARVVDADSTQIGRHLAGLGRRVLTFVGYSDAGYEDPQAMLDAAARVLDAHDPRTTLVNIGATPGGIGAIYEIAHQRGFMTSGIVSSQARVQGVALSPFVELVFVVADERWGGLVPGTSALSPTSQAIVDHSDVVVAIGGGEVARDEFEGALHAGTPTLFIDAEMNHAAARAAAARKGQPAPTEFGGAAALRFSSR
jgi:hypothetical protein